MCIRFSKTFCACCFCVCTRKTPLTRNPLKWQRRIKRNNAEGAAGRRGEKDKKDNLFLNTSWQKVAGENGGGGGKKSSRYLFNFTVEPFWQEAIILFYFFFYMISPRPLPRGRIFLCRLSAVDLIFLRPGRYYGNFLGTELQFNFVLTHELLLLLFLLRTTRCMGKQDLYCSVAVYLHTILTKQFPNENDIETAW